ncbi:MFS transporter [Buttiauxella noackiae]|uniref:MFS transporter n=1 Tax=Buttiauxella noackiae TaxID=82992 RepID=UPI0023556103|nr:MFS transporter [Buttiauxella noackiae]MCA1920804.1 MFS transporter [Buttiauxella noackiae]
MNHNTDRLAQGGGVAPAQPVHWRVIVAAVAGNAFEVYDFVIYAYFAVYIGQTFFPITGEYGSLLVATATFGVGFFTRPLGALLIGSYADRVGRKPAMILTVSLITLGTMGIALTPSYASIGMIAPVIVVCCRLLQGIALGGEIGPATSLLIESAPADKRGRYACWQIASQGIAVTTGGLIGVIITLTMSPENLQSYGWRIPFIFSLLMVPLTIYIRRNVPETLHAEDKKEDKTVDMLKGMWRDHRRFLLIGLCIMIVVNVTSQLINYMTSYAIKTLHLDPSIAQTSILIAGLVSFFGALAAGRLSDKYGRKKVLILPVIVLCIVVVPLFSWLHEAPDATRLLTVTFVISAMIVFPTTAVLVIVPEILPAGYRSTGTSLIYALGSALFGGTTHFILTALLAWTNHPVAPAYYVLFAAAVSLCAMSLLPETRDLGVTVNKTQQKRVASLPLAKRE